jgi:capsular polysaccharide biosynthesis protein
MNEGKYAQTSERDEMSLVDVFRFLKGAWKAIIIFGLIGIVLSIVYLAFTPKQYEATAQIAMAQIIVPSNTSYSSLNPQGINIEDPNLLIARLSTPTSFDSKVINACGLDGKPDAAAILAKNIKLSLPKGIPNIVELKTVDASPEAARSCASAIFELIARSQSQILAPYIEEAKVKLEDDEARLAKAVSVVAKADKSGQAMSASYLSTRDEVRFLLDEIAGLKNVVFNNKNRGTRLIAPIYASDAPIAPKKRMALMSGIFGGLFLGLLIAIARHMLLELKSVSRGVL